MERVKKIKEREAEKRLDNYHKDLLKTKLPDIPDADSAPAVLEDAMTSRSQPGEKPSHPLLAKKASVMSMSRPIGAKSRVFGGAAIKKKKKKKKKRK